MNHVPTDKLESVTAPRRERSGKGGKEDLIPTGVFFSWIIILCIYFQPRRWRLCFSTWIGLFLNRTVPAARDVSDNMGKG
jgi:hypothetical protein